MRTPPVPVEGVAGAGAAAASGTSAVSAAISAGAVGDAWQASRPSGSMPAITINAAACFMPVALQHVWEM